MHPDVKTLKGGLVVSCQADPDSALFEPQFMAAMAQEAERGGAVGLRIDGPANVAAARRVTRIPILGINKRKFEGYEPYITVTFELAKEVVDAGAALVAIDGTGRPLPGGVTLKKLIGRIHDELRIPVMADVSTAAEGIAAEKAGADIVATTLAGYTGAGRPRIPDQPDFDLVMELVKAVKAPVLVEGRITTPEQAAEAFRLGAYAVCVGSIITKPRYITSRFVAAVKTRRVS